MTQIDLFSLLIILCGALMLAFILFARVWHWLMSPMEPLDDTPSNIAPFPHRWEPSMSDDGSQEQAR